MIILDTHLWIWWNHNDSKLTPAHRKVINRERPYGLGVCSISWLEISRLVTQNKLILPCSIQEWFNIAFAQEGVILLSITPQIAIDSYSLPGDFHKDPADRIIVATARIYNVPLVSIDEKILAYSHIKRILP
ncbi:type II toxin-antitoxin system VapC family toxin [Desmonostoc muscorum LEGE 12446]|uniref:Type II toxin-antitoxin system VapC family toxin n=1 Tax=Desmonostoc muscorum LEGE 12446 TaxID=1828758 RepID=A0A8J7DE33_DESMC|nr:type II toxin-antitoxin system VapC family toxin [Desmonostoc muscorum]MCF2144926.1 type II toxin-antitoxin system VapC family toxin [Desmonostoc muscorum LEGE 12446]